MFTGSKQIKYYVFFGNLVILWHVCIPEAIRRRSDYVMGIIDGK